MTKQNINKDISKLDKLPILKSNNPNNLNFTQIISQYATQILNIIKDLPVSPSKV